MKTDMGRGRADGIGGSSADKPDDGLEERLSGRFAVEVSRAERDYPALRDKVERGAAGGAADAGRGRGWPKLALPITSAAVLAVVALLAGSLWSGSLRGPSGPAPLPSGPAASGIVMGSDGIPTQIDGQRVYRVGDHAAWRNIQGSFLLGVIPNLSVPVCIVTGSSVVPEQDLVQRSCGGGMLVGVVLGDGVTLAPKSSGLLTAWTGHAVVVRVHTHDPEAAQCSAAQQAQCEAAVVVEVVVWPTVPAEIAGERVYRVADQASFPKTGSFLLGGVFARPDVMPPCPMPIDKNNAEQQLLPYCYVVMIDGIQLAPMSQIDEPNGEIVVARVHVNDPLAAQCPETDRAQCQASVVVESVVSHSMPYTTALSSPVGPTGTPGTNPATTPDTGPMATPPVPPLSQVPDLGVPTAVGGEPVYRASNMPSSDSFLLGGKLTRDTSCAAPATPMANPPACGYWMIDGVKVGTMVDMNVASIGQIVIARVSRGRVLAVCPGGSCTKDTLVVTEIVWPNLEPPPPAGSPQLP
jgi:hypothetical protein